MAERKALTVELKATQEGAFRATFATLGVIDKDGDVTKEGAFAKQPVRVSQFGHNWGAYIIGDGSIDADKTKAWADAEFYLETANGLDTYRSVKRASAKGLQEWSYGFDVVKSSYGQFEGREVRFLEELLVHEISPVMLGAGIGTQTDFIKSGSMTLEDERSAVLAATERFSKRISALVTENAKVGRALSEARIARIREVIANARGSASTIADAADELEKMLAEAGITEDDGKAALQAIHAQFIHNARVLATR